MGTCKENNSKMELTIQSKYLSGGIIPARGSWPAGTKVSKRSWLLLRMKKSKANHRSVLTVSSLPTEVDLDICLSFVLCRLIIWVKKKELYTNIHFLLQCLVWALIWHPSSHSGSLMMFINGPIRRQFSIGPTMVIETDFEIMPVRNAWMVIKKVVCIENSNKTRHLRESSWCVVCIGRKKSKSYLHN